MRFRYVLAMWAVICAWTPIAHSQPTPVTGAGATFPTPLYQRWAQDASRVIHVQLNYQSIGSGGGTNQIMARTVDFGATDAPVSADRLTQNNLIQVPMVMGALVLAYNLPGVPAGSLRLTPEVLVDMYMGRITRWSDVRITQLNPHVRIPNLPLGVVYRGDGSGTTWIFTNYLSRVSEDWNTKSGAGTNISWPAGQGARGNEGVSNMVQRTPGLIGYMEIAFAKLNNLPIAQLQNAHGNFVTADAQSSLATAQNANWGTNLVPDLINQPGAQTWPIMGATYVLIPTNPTNAARARAVNAWVTWALEHGAATAERLHYVSLPPTVRQQVISRIQSEVRLP